MFYCNYYIDMVGVQCSFMKFNQIALLKSEVQASGLPGMILAHYMHVTKCIFK
jgi:hypothetical protein